MTRVEIPSQNVGGSAAGAAMELIRVCKSFGGICALDGITLSVPPQETTVLIGPSGCGKSTVLRLMAALIAPEEGEVWFDGVRVEQRRVLELRRRMGYVIQDGGLFPHLSAGENVTLMARYLGWPVRKVRDRLQELAALTQFPVEGLNRFPVQLSGGQRQRVSLMRALMLDPDVLLMDEPLGALDPMIRAQLQQELREIFRKLGKTVVLVTHDMGEAAYLGDVLVLMRDGRIVQQGTLRQMMEAPTAEFVTHFIQAQRQVYGGTPCTQ